ncbi:MAG: flagellar basal-body rod protein FlgF [Aliidongia sp.]
MQTATYVALAHQTALESGIDVMVNNLANMSTPAFKGETVLFSQYLQPAQGGGDIAYVRDVGVRRDTKQGNLTQTGNSLDAGVEGDGYFTVGTTDGQRYTRNGRFTLDNGGNLVTTQGYQLLSDQGQPITLPANTRQITISTDGQVSTETGPVAKIGLAHFDNQQDLVGAADGLYVTNDQPTPDTTSKLHQGTVEESNVNAISAMTKLMGLQQAYTGAAQIIEGEDQRIKNAIDKISRVA